MPSAMKIWFSATVRKTHAHEARTRDELVEKIAAYYAEDAEPDEDNGRYYAPEVESVIRYHSDGDGETVMSAAWTKELNDDIEKRFQAVIVEGEEEAAHRREVSSLEATGRI